MIIFHAERPPPGNLAAGWQDWQNRGEKRTAKHSDVNSSRKPGGRPHAHVLITVCLSQYRSLKSWRRLSSLAIKPAEPRLGSPRLFLPRWPRVRTYGFHPIRFRIVAHRMIVGFRLPEWLSSRALQRLPSRDIGPSRRRLVPA